MINNISVCGDSFATGVGLPEETCFEDFFGGLVAKEFGLPLNVYARSGCCNFTIYLQIKKIIENYKNYGNLPLVLISITYHERYLLPIGDDIIDSDLDLSYVDYHNYPPYSDGSRPKRDMSFESKTPKLFSQTLTNINLFLEEKPSGAHFSSFQILPKRKLELVRDYSFEVGDEKIKKEYDNAILTKGHLLLKNMNIPHIFMVNSMDSYSHLPQENVCHIDWGQKCLNYPDRFGSGHCDERGHIEVFESLKNKCKTLIDKHEISLL
jgi:hypothetical protein